MLQRPATGEFGEYYGKYIDLVPAGDVREHLARQIHESLSLMSGVSEEKAEKGYEAGKWTLKEVVGHMSDTERVFTYRLLRIARGDETPLPGFEQDDWVPTSCSNARTMASHLLEFAAVRSSRSGRTS